MITIMHLMMLTNMEHSRQDILTFINWL